MLSTSDIIMAISIFRQSITDLFWNTRWPCLQIIQGMSEQLSACTTVTHTSTHNVIRPNRRLGPLIKLRNQLLNTPPPPPLPRDKCHQCPVYLTMELTSSEWLTFRLLYNHANRIWLQVQTSSICRVVFEVYLWDLMVYGIS